MKRIVFTLIAIFFFTGFVKSQTTQTTPPKQAPDTVKIWKHGLLTSFNFNQVSLTNWAAGGESSLALSGMISGFANYKKGNISWDNSTFLGYGIIKSDNNPSKKNQDKIELNSKLGYRATDKLNYAALVSFNSQFAKGYNYPNVNDPYQKQYVSNFFAPAYIILSLGMDYKPTTYLSFYLSPATGRFIFVSDQALADEGSYGITPAVSHYDTLTKKTIIDKHAKTKKTEFGAFFSGKFQKEIMKNVNLMTRITLFDDYTNPDSKKRTNMVVNWEVLLDMKVNKYISASIYTNLVYDDQINIPVSYTPDKLTVTKSGPRTQFKEVLGIGFSHKF